MMVPLPSLSSLFSAIPVTAAPSVPCYRHCGSSEALACAVYICRKGNGEMQHDHCTVDPERGLGRRIEEDATGRLVFTPLTCEFHPGW